MGDIKVKTRIRNPDLPEFVPLDPLEQMIEKTRDLLDELEDALTSVATDSLRISHVDNPPNLDVALSTRLAEATFTGRWDGGIYGWDGAAAQKIKTDTAGELQIDVLSTANPPNLDVALSTRASETSLSGFSGKFPTAAALGDTLANPTTTIIGAALLGFDGTNWGRLRAVAQRLEVDKVHLFQFDTENRLINHAEPHRISPTATATGDGTATSFTLNLGTEKGGRKILWLNNAFDQEATIEILGTVDGTNYFTMRSGISIPAGQNRWAVINGALQGVRISITTTIAPSTGTTFDAKIFGLF